MSAETDSGIYLVLLETGGNQAFIFATNKLAENMGASQLVWRSTTVALLEAVKEMTGRGTLRSGATAADVHSALLDPAANPPIESPHGDVEVVTASSGKALVLVHGRANADALVGRVTRWALEHAPGLALHGTSVPIVLEGLTMAGFQAAVNDVHAALHGLKARLPAAEARFLRVPVVAECGTSGLPAARYDDGADDLGDRRPRSALSIAKRGEVKAARRRLTAPWKEAAFRIPATVRELDDLPQSVEWLAVVHADGNGIGHIFKNFDLYVPAAGNRETRPEHRRYIDALRRFSVALDLCTEAATTEAMGSAFESMTERHKAPIGDGEDRRPVLPVVPVVLGGDDLTVVCDGRMAVRFARNFLAAFERQTAANAVVSPVAEAAFGYNRLGSCAGVAIVKPHFPFHAAYELSEALLTSAKQGKRKIGNAGGRPVPFTALDFHVHYDGSGADLDPIRARMVADGGETRLHGRPYVVTPAADLPPSAWADRHRWEHLEWAVSLLVEQRKGGDRAIPRSQLHALRESLFLGAEAAAGQFKLIENRYRPAGLARLLDLVSLPERDEHELFCKDGPGRRFTRLLDALDLVEFWQ